MAPSAKAEGPGTYGPGWLEGRVRELLGSPGSLPPFAVAFSGGADSTALLHAAARAFGETGVRAIHVDHGLHPDSAVWAGHCARAAETIGVPFLCLRITVAAGQIAAQGVEAAAREARYGALTGALEPGECLLTAQHREDQLETVLLQLMRGAGLAGLSAMGPLAGMGGALLLRPLLELGRGDLAAYLEAAGVEWLEDPANRDLRFDRSFLRGEILPRLRERWPAADASGARSAAHLAAGAALLRQLAAADLAKCDDGEGRIRLGAFRRLEPERRRNALRHWIASAGFLSPGRKRLESVLDHVIDAAEDAMPLVALGDCEIRRYRDHLYLSAAGRYAMPLPDRIPIVAGTPTLLPAGLGTFALRPGAVRGIDPDLLAAGSEIRFRTGGERLVPGPRRPRRRLKHLLREAGVVPWMRERIPLLYCAGRLVAVGDLWLAEDCRRNGGLAPRWEGHPPLY